MKKIDHQYINLKLAESVSKYLNANIKYSPTHKKLNNYKFSL